MSQIEDWKLPPIFWHLPVREKREGASDRAKACFREELNRIAREPFLAIKQSLEVKIEHIKYADTKQTDYVQIIWTSTGTVKNVTSKKAKINIGFMANDWGYPGHSSKILGASYQVSGHDVKHYQDSLKPDKGVIVKSSWECVPLGTGENDYIEIYQKAREIHRTNSIMYWTFPYACTDPRVSVEVPNDIECLVEFLHPGGAKAEHELAPRTYTLSGTFLAGQPIVIRWWPKGFNASPCSDY